MCFRKKVNMPMFSEILQDLGDGLNETAKYNPFYAE